MSTNMAVRSTNKVILDELDRLYPEAGPELHFTNPYETLVAVMLSAQCTDRQVNKVTPQVFAKYPDIQSMAVADPNELFELVKSCGFKSKAGNIIRSCAIIVEQFDGKVPKTMEELTSLPGVGRKTANVVMASAYGIPALAVDTHVFRVSNRLGIAKAESVEKTEDQLKKAIPKEIWITAHHWLILHGRRVCKAQKPMCETCTLKECCKAYNGQKKEPKR